MKVTSIDQLSSLSQDNLVQDTIDQYLGYHEASGSSDSTKRAYRYHLGEFLQFLQRQGVSTVERISPDLIRQNLAELQNAGLKPNTVHGRYRHVKAWLIFLENQETITTNPIRKVKAPKRPKVIHPALSEDEVRKITLSLRGTDAYSVRNMAIWLTMLDTALRLKEVAGIKVGQIDQGSGVIKVTGKGSKDRFVRIGNQTLRSVSKWVRLRQGEPEDALWLGKQGPMGDHGITMLFKKVSQSTGVHVHPHKVRRTAALLMLRSGMDLATLSLYMGHESIQTTMLYLALDNTDLARSHAQHSPVDGLL
ncbi:MAG: tyrosine-type recombinase/integrase [Fimbriimonadaceae bacterium]